MNLMRWLAATCLAGLAALLLPVGGNGQEKKETVYYGASDELLAKVLDGLDLRYKKTAGSKAGVAVYSFERNNHVIRLSNHEGKDLWIEADFPGAPLERINRWNEQAKFSRAVLARAGDREMTLLNAQLDCVAGVTEGILRQFLGRFETEVRNVERFLNP